MAEINIEKWHKNLTIARTAEQRWREEKNDTKRMHFTLRIAEKGNAV
jgi:hypothetical protein